MSREWPTQRGFKPRQDASPSGSSSPSPDPELVRFLAQQARPASPDTEALRKQRIAAGGVSHIKSRHRREREEAERRRKEEEEDAARAYREFVEDMQGGPTTAGRTGDQTRHGHRQPGFVRAGGSAYAPLSAQQTVQDEQQSARKKEDERSGGGAFGDETDELEALEAEKRSSRELPGKRKGAMQDFLGELQRDQARREERLRERVSESTSVSSLLAQEMQKNIGPRDENDPHSSNVCVLNLPANVSEASMGEYFSYYGDVASVKIMWPRTEPALQAPIGHGLSARTTRHEGATGFVNFMRREDAQVAYKEIDGSRWAGSVLHTGWSRSLPKPARPLFPKSIRSKMAHEAEVSAHTNDSSRRTETRKRRSSRSPSSRHHRRQWPRSESPTTHVRTRVRTEEGEEVEKTILSVANRVREYGPGFEAMMREREAANPLFAFLREQHAPGHELYRSLVDATYVPKLTPKAFSDEGYASLYSSDTEEESEWDRLSGQNRKDVLGNAAGRRLDAMLRSLTLRRERIAHVMLFAIDRAHCAEVITQRLVDSLLIASTPLPRKMARLYAVSDVLHNSSAPASSAWRYRSLFESQLDRVFQHWGDVAYSFAGRIKREACRDMARALLDVWDTWLVFDSSRLTRWRSFVEEGSGTQERLLVEDESHDVDGEPLEPEPVPAVKTDQAGIDEEDIDGEALEDLDGAEV